MKFYVVFVFQFVVCASMPFKSKLTLDEFFDYTTFPSLRLSPNGQHLLVHARHPSWDTNSFENSLWLYKTFGRKKKLITKNLAETFKPQWSPSGNWILLRLNEENSTISTRKNDAYFQRSHENGPQTEQHIYLYCIASDELISIPIGTDIPTAITWSNNDSSLYFAAITSTATNEADNLHETEWKDVIQYRELRASYGSIIHRIDINRKNRKSPVNIHPIKSMSFLVGELLFSPSEQKLLLTSVTDILERNDDFEIYSIDLRNSSVLSKLTNNEYAESNLKLSNDGKKLLFQMSPLRSKTEILINTQQRLFSVDLKNGQIERLAKDFEGNIVEYTTRPDGGIFILGQVGTNVQIYSQQSPRKFSILHRGWTGKYEALSSSFNRNNSIAFVYSSFERPKEVYFIDNIDRLNSAKVITSENKIFTQRDLPQTKVYQWTSDEDDRTIEGILHYPPGKFESENLPLLVLIHGGPFTASINHFDANWYSWAPLAASEGWLVLEPNYRGSTGYGDQFVNEIQLQPLSRPGRDILSGVDRLIKDGIVDPNSLAIGGYSYGGVLTNWLITQTTRFNAALSGAGTVEHVSDWGTTDIPPFSENLFGGFPWDVPHAYQNESPIYQLNKVRTPTHIVTGDSDIRVPVHQNYILERGLYYLEIPVKLLLFPKEGHALSNNPWHGKIKVREELKWLQTYGHKSAIATKN